jgi:DNA-binding MarR family transcriptional regulator
VPTGRSANVQMWDYAVLGALESAQTQTQLAAAVGRDKTRLIPILDRLEGRDLLRRAPDPADRRNRVVALTDEGRTVLQSCRAAIRELEARLLADFGPDERIAFVSTLERLAASVGHP